MANSLRDQLLKAGLVDQKQVRKAKQTQRQERKRTNGKVPGSQEDLKRETRRAKQEKAERDRELNRQRQESQARKAVEAQVRQLVEQSAVVDEGDICYNFVDAERVKRIYVTKTVQDQLGRGRLAIVKLDGRYHLVPPEVAEKVRQRDASLVVLLNEPDQGGAGENPYADHPIPDDLMW